MLPSRWEEICRCFESQAGLLSPPMIRELMAEVEKVVDLRATLLWAEILAHEAKEKIAMAESAKNCALAANAELVEEQRRLKQQLNRMRQELKAIQAGSGRANGE